MARAFESNWFDEKRSCVLIVPSVVARIENNPDHSDFDAVRPSLEQPVTWNNRLFSVICKFKQRRRSLMTQTRSLNESCCSMSWQLRSDLHHAQGRHPFYVAERQIDAAEPNDLANMALNRGISPGGTASVPVPAPDVRWSQEQRAGNGKGCFKLVQGRGKGGWYEQREAGGREQGEACPASWFPAPHDREARHGKRSRDKRLVHPFCISKDPRDREESCKQGHRHAVNQA
jgi:hypothetical protein